jgi:hypothetical protein
MAIETTLNFYPYFPGNIDSRLGPYSSSAHATGSIESIYRYPGMTVFISSSTETEEYWWRDGVNNNQLILKTGSGQTYLEGPGIDINSNYISASLGAGLEFDGSNKIQAQVRTVNLQGPTNGNIPLSITNTITGLSSSLSGSPFFLPNTYSPRPPISGTIFVVSGETGPTVSKNGEAYIFVTSSTQAGSWQQIFGFNETTADLRYVRLFSTTSQNITSSLLISGSNVIFSSSLYWPVTESMTGGGPVNTLVWDPATNKIKTTGSYGGGGGGATPGGANTTIQFNDGGSALSGSGNFTFNKINNTVNLSGSLVVTGSTILSSSLQAIGTTNITGSLIISSSSNVVGTSRVTGSLIVSSSFQAIGTGSISGSLSISSSILGQTVLQITGTGSNTTAPMVQIAGQTGGFVQVYDFNSGSLFSVNGNTGTAIVDVRSNGQTLIGSNTFQGMYDSTANIAFVSPSQNLTVPGYLTSSYNALWFDYVVFSGSYSRMGTLYSAWSGSNISYNDVTGSYTGTVPTDNITLVTRFSSSFVQVTASAATNNWVIKGMIRCI